MPTYHANEFSFDIPASLIDKTTHILTVSENGPSPFNITIARTAVAPNATLEAFAEQLGQELPKALPGFQLYARKAIAIAGQPAIQFDYQWESEGTKLLQRQIGLIAALPDGTRRFLQITATAAEAFTSEHARIFGLMLGTLRLRQGDTPQAEP